MIKKVVIWLPKLQRVLEESDHPDPFQFGFKSMHGTEMAPVALIDDINLKVYLSQSFSTSQCHLIPSSVLLFWTNPQCCELEKLCFKLVPLL